MLHCAYNYRKETSLGRNAYHGPNPHTPGTLRDAATVTDAGRIADPARIADSSRIADPGTIKSNGDKAMTFSSLVRNRSSGSTASLGAAESVGGPQVSSTQEAPLPFAGYERLDADKVIERLSDHSQIELQGIENYERSHKGREAVLNKLRYLRGNEPFPGYDALSVEETLATLKDADMATIKRVRGYERKFANRPRVLDEVARLHKERRAMQPATRPPGYQPASARSGASARRARRGPEDGGAQRP